MINGFGSGMATIPDLMYRSIGLTATALTRTRTSPSFGAGAGSSPWRMTSGAPEASMYAAFMATSKNGMVALTAL
jgi:hypothetical protein